ncbi:MAG: hypothetical protein A2138_04460 [Deltaproteobacteria bacterium RBG_16_71_12]|nr:MAG: hypothetical protein A2138_04460 [Deltaproteobacteria bacterium RBG_16_71_12]
MDAPVATEQPAAAPRPLLRVALPELQLTDVPRRWGRLISLALALELRKLERTSVLTDDEIRTLLQHEADKQMLACAQESCFAELADALGVDALVIGTVAVVGDQHVFGLKRLDPVHAKVVGQVTRRFEVGNGEALLVAIGPAVAELFPDVPLRANQTRGVPREVALRLNPPPLRPWVVIAGSGATATCAVAAGIVGGVNLMLADQLATYKAGANPFVTQTFSDKVEVVDTTAVATWALTSAALVLGSATGVAALFTDFSDEGEP